MFDEEGEHEMEEGEQEIDEDEAGINYNVQEGGASVVEESDSDSEEDIIASTIKKNQTKKQSTLDDLQTRFNANKKQKTGDENLSAVKTVSYQKETDNI